MNRASWAARAKPKAPLEFELPFEDPVCAAVSSNPYWGSDICTKVLFMVHRLPVTPIMLAFYFFLFTGLSFQTRKGNDYR
jgi:hypothetical protein